MTYKEFKEKFPVGSRIVAEMNYDIYGTIFDYSDIYEIVQIKWEDKAYFNDYFTCHPAPVLNDQYISNMKLVSEIENIQENKTCPRCSSEMTKKQSELYGLIDKCPNCGYC